MRRVFFVSAVLFLTACSGSTPKAGAPETPLEFGGAYKDLESAQRQLVVAWFERYDEITGKRLAPTSGYGERTHGTHFAAMFQLRRAGEHAPVLSLLWAQEDGAWKVISYHAAIP